MKSGALFTATFYRPVSIKDFSTNLRDEAIHSSVILYTQLVTMQ